MPNIESAWQYLVKAESLKAMNEAINHLRKCCKEATSADLLNEDYVRKLKKETNKVYKKLALGNPEEIISGKLKLKVETEKILEEKIKIASN